MVARIVFALLLLGQFLLLTGCWDIKEIQSMVYVNAIGIDYDDERFTVYAQVTDFASVAKQESGAPVGAQVWVGEGIGPTINDAFFDLYQTSQLRIYWGHMTAIVLGQSIFKNNKLQNVFDLMERYHEIRANVWIYSTDDPMEEIMGSLSFFKRSAVYTILHEPVETYKQSSALPPLYLFRFMSDYTERGKTVHIPNVKLFKHRWSVDGQSFPLLGVNGSNIVQRGVYKGFLDMMSLTGYRWFVKEFSRGDLTVYKDGKIVAELILTNVESKIKPIIQDGEPKFNVKIRVKGRTNELHTTISEKELESLARQEIIKEIQHSFQKGLSIQADVLNLGYVLYRYDSKNWYMLYGKDEHRFPLSENAIANLNVKVNLMSSGKLRFRDGYNPHKR